MPEDTRERQEEKRQVCAWARALFSGDLRTKFILDTETSGDNRGRRDEALEVGVVDLSGATRYSSLVRPQYPRLEKDLATHIHGIGPRDLERAPSFPEIWPALREVLLQASVLITYNVSFDRTILTDTARRYKINLPKLPWECAMLQYSLFYGEPSWKSGEYKWQRLSDAGKRLNIPVDPTRTAHRAVSDCLDTLDVLKALSDLYTPPVLVQEKLFEES